jgi:hypothetical protein
VNTGIQRIQVVTGKPMIPSVQNTTNSYNSSSRNTVSVCCDSGKMRMRSWNLCVRKLTSRKARAC